MKKLPGSNRSEIGTKQPVEFEKKRHASMNLLELWRISVAADQIAKHMCKQQEDPSFGWSN
jgi:hypothetical protein